jgi:hypothetical protein
VQISKARVRDGVVPAVCSRHGRPDVHPCQLTLTSRPATWSYALGVLGLLGLVAGVVVTLSTDSSQAPFVAFGSLVLLVAPLLSRFKVSAPRWPFCERCRAEHLRGLLIALGTLAVGVVILGGGVWLDNGWLMLAGLGVIVAAAGVALRFSWRVLSQAIVSRQEAMVVIRRPHPQFAEAALAPVHQRRSP